MIASAARDELQFLQGLRYLGVDVEADEGRLNISAPPGTLTDPMRTAIRARKADLLAALQLQSASMGEAAELPLSFEQERAWLAQQLAPESADFNLALAFRVTGPLHPPALAQALADIVYRHEILRTIYVGGAQPSQKVTRPERVPLAIVDLTGLPEETRERVARRLASAEAHRRFDLASDLMIRATLVKLGLGQHCLLILRHHIAADGWSLGLLLRELVFAYQASCLGRPAALRAPAIQYARYAILQRFANDEGRVSRQLEYWREKLQGADPTVFQHIVPEHASATGKVELRTISLEVAQRVGAWCRDLKVTAFSTYLAAFLIILQYRSGRSDLLIGTDYANRDSMETESVIGMFVKRLPLRCRLREGWSVLELIQHLQRVTFEACSHALVPLQRLALLLNSPRAGGAAPFQILFGMHAAPAHAPYRDLKLHGTERCELLDVAIGSNEFPLSLYVSDAAAGPVAELRYDPAFFAGAEAGMLLQQLETLLRTIGTGGNPSLSALRAVLSAADRQAVAAFSRVKAHRLSRQATVRKSVQP